MTKLDQIKIIDNKIKANRTQFMLDRKNAEISAKSSGELDKFEYLTGEDLGYKPDALTQAEFEYSPLGKVFTAGLEKSDKKERLFKRLRSIEDKTQPKLPTGLFPQLPYNNRAANRIGYRGDNGDNDDDDDDNNNDYDQLEAKKKESKDRGDLERSVDEEFNRIVRASRDLEGKKFAIGRDNNMHSRLFNNDFEKLINNYLNKKIAYEDIANK